MSKCPYCVVPCNNNWCSYKEDSNMDSKFEKFLKEDCEAGEYMVMTLMVNKQHVKEFLQHMDKFDARCGVIQNGTSNSEVLGLDKKVKLKVIDKDEKN